MSGITVIFRKKQCSILDFQSVFHSKSLEIYLCLKESWSYLWNCNINHLPYVIASDWYSNQFQ